LKATKRPTRPQADRILIRGVRVHNLRNINLDLPRNRLIVVTGVSGSGKSSLAFDTIYAEGQRRYVESLSAYARQFLERMEKPDLDSIQGIGPAMAIEQKTNTRNPRSTVATSTEIYDYLRLLFARIGVTLCRKCGQRVTRDSAESILRFLEGLVTAQREGKNGDGLKVMIAFPLPEHAGETVQDAIAFVRKEGFFRLLHAGEVVDTREGSLPDGLSRESTFVLLDRVVYRSGEDHARFVDSLETAFSSGSGMAILVFPDDGSVHRFNRQFACARCLITYEEPEPRLFSFNSPVGACPECQGFGRAMGIDMDLVVPDKSKTLRRGAIQPWTTPKFAENLRRLIHAGPKAGIRVDVPFADLTPEERASLMEGSAGFEGIRDFFRKVERKSYKIFYRVLLSRYRGYTTCSLCGGARVKQEALNVRVGGKRISDVVALTVREALQFFNGLDLTSSDRTIAQRILGELRRRLKYLDDVGIGYLSLDRLSSTLSGGESQRINLATSLGSSLVGAFYVLDEPSIGLHPRDGEKLIAILKALRDMGNTVLVVEHDREIMDASDFIVDLGPGAGELGGEVVFAGPADTIRASEKSLTGRYLSGRSRIPVPAQRRQGNGKRIVVNGASEHNLKNLTVPFPLGVMVCVTGVSGSGKSTLIYDVLYQGLSRAMGDFSGREPLCASIEGLEHIQAVESVDQSPIGRTPRSNPVTYIQVFDQIRTLFSKTQGSRIHGFKPGHFSFNVPGGRCEACEGDGVIKVERQFMADLYLTCDACKGMRFQR